MSFQESKTEDNVKLEFEQPVSHFEKHIINCCKADEWTLRSKLKKWLVRAGFRIIEDNYKTDRVAKDKRYESVHNMLAIRGENPRVCLAAHTDVCRDHFSSRYGSFSESHWMNNKEDDEEKEQTQKADPVIKSVWDHGQKRRIIQDRNCKTQVGGDDRLGVAINTWIALNSGYDMGLYFPTDEEIGLKSAGACEMKELKEFDLIAQVDRGNHSNELVVKIGGETLISYESASRLLWIAYKLAERGIGEPRTPVAGLGTDVVALKRRGFCKEAVNMTCGYHNSVGAQANEYIDINEARDTMLFVQEIVRDYYLEGIEGENK